MFPVNTEMPKTTYIEIDGSHGEGGGQVLRTSLALSIITGRAFRITRIRGNRQKPGLMRQHLTGVRAAAEISGASVTGAELHSQELTFAPARAGLTPAPTTSLSAAPAAPVLFFRPFSCRYCWPTANRR